MRLDSPILLLDGAPVLVKDVLAAGRIGGWLEDDASALRDFLVLTAWANQQNIPDDDDALQEAIDQWRSDLNLLSADEMERWMVAHGLTLNDVIAYQRGKMLNDRHSDQLDLLELDADERDHVYGEPLMKFLILDLRLDSILDIFGRRAAVEAPPYSEQFQRERQRILERAGLDNPVRFAEAMDALGVDLRRANDWVDLEASYELWRQRVLSDERLNAELKRRWSDMSWFKVTVAMLPDEDAARELIGLAKFDGRQLEDAAKQVDASVYESLWYQEDLARYAFGYRLPGTRVGEVFGPYATPEYGGGFMALQLMERGEPELSDTTVRERLEWRLINHELRDTVAERIRHANPAEVHA